MRTKHLPKGVLVRCSPAEAPDIQAKIEMVMSETPVWVVTHVPEIGVGKPVQNIGIATNALMISVIILGFLAEKYRDGVTISEGSVFVASPQRINVYHPMALVTLDQSYVYNSKGGCVSRPKEVEQNGKDRADPEQ